MDMFVRSEIVLKMQKYVLLFIFVMATCLLLSYCVKVIFDVDMREEFFFAGAIGMVVPSTKKKYIPKKQ